MADNVRQNKVGSLLQGIVSQFFVLHPLDELVGKVILIDGVVVSADLKYADVWISFSPYVAEKAERWFELVQMQSHTLQKFIFSKMQIRRVPEVRLHLSDTDQISRVIDALNKS